MSFYPIDMNTYLGQTVNYGRYLSASVEYWQLPEFSENKSLEQILNSEKLRLGIDDPQINNLLAEVRGTLRDFKEAKLQDRYANDVFAAYKDIWRSYSRVNEIRQLLDIELYKFKNYHLIKETGSITETNTEIDKNILNLTDQLDELRPINDWFWNVLDKLRYCFENFVPELFEREKELFYKLPYVDEQFVLYYKIIENPQLDPTTQPGPNQPDQPEPVNQPSPGVKLKWNGSNDALYDLFAQLSLVNVSQSTGLIGNTIEDIARFIAGNFDGMPTAETIERRIRAFREPNGQRPKRSRIELDIFKGEQ